MGKQSIITEKVAAVASQLNSANNNINQAFERMRNSANVLGSAWKSPAGSRAQTKMYEIFKGNTPRSNVLINYVRQLTEVTNPSYVETENANLKLSDQFK